MQPHRAAGAAAADSLLSSLSLLNDLFNFDAGIYHFLILTHHPNTSPSAEREVGEKERDKHIFSERIVERNAIEFGCFFMRQPLLCAG